MGKELDLTDDLGVGVDHDQHPFVVGPEPVRAELAPEDWFGVEPEWEPGPPGPRGR